MAPPDQPPAGVGQVSDIPDVRPDWDGSGFGPPVFLQLDGESVTLDPWTSCYENGCADGFPKPPFYDVGNRSVVPFSFPDEGWDFQATFRPTGTAPVDCGRALSVSVRKTGRYTFEIPAVGPPGAYDVELFGNGPSGDAVTTFRWDTTSAGVLPEPHATASVLVEDDGQLTSWGVSVELHDVANLPDSVTATVVVTSKDGRSVRLGPYRDTIRCPAAGDVYVLGPERDGQRAAELGDGPWTYRVELELGDREYTGTGVWPDDHNADPFNDDPTPTALTFEPPLPAYAE